MIPLRVRSCVRRRPWATWSLLAVLGLMFALQHLWAGWAGLALVPARFDGRGLAGLVTHVLLHGGAVHLLGNLLFLHAFGPGVEDVLGGRRLLLLFFASGVAGGLAKVLVEPRSPLPVVGASGAISGVLAAALVLGPTRPVLTWVPYLIVVQLVEVPTWVFVVLWFALQLALAYAALGADLVVAPFVHLGGFLAGLGLAYALLPRNARDG